jgi:glycosyltransferase involved in cell wall biosynthesis
MKILFVAFPFSIHTTRWIQQLTEIGWEIHLFPSMDFQPLHPGLETIIYHQPFYNLPESRNGDRLATLFKNLWVKKISRKVAGLADAGSQVARLKKVIAKVKPDIIHSLEMQHAGYLVNETRKNYQGNFPVWIHSNWGIDLHFFGKLSAHKEAIGRTLSAIDVFITEGNRDEQLAREYGFKGPVFTFPSVGGGFKIPNIKTERPSSRKKILVKGSQDMVRRGLVALRALERCRDALAGYELCMYSANEITRVAAEQFQYNTGIKINIIEEVSQQEMFVLNAQARLNICVNMSDGVPNAMLEAMLMGAFPIQSETSMAQEWVTNGETGFIVPPEDPDIIESVIRTVLREDGLVDAAAPLNREKITSRLDFEEIKKKAINLYTDALNKREK